MKLKKVTEEEVIGMASVITPRARMRKGYSSTQEEHPIPVLLPICEVGENLLRLF